MAKEDVQPDEAPAKPGASEDTPAAGWVPSATEPIVAPDGHVVLSKEDIKNYG